MSVKSKFYQATEQLLIEYKTDSYAIANNTTTKDGTYFHMFKSLDGKQYYLPMNKTNIKFADETKTTYLYPGKNAELSYENNKSVNVMTDTNTKLGEVYDNDTNYANYYFDTINIYILTGYVLNSLAGLSVNVKAKISSVKNQESGVEIRLSDYITLLDWYMPKEELKDKQEWLKSPLYLNSRFYDRKITITFPSPIDAASIIDNNETPEGVDDSGIKYHYYQPSEDGSRQIEYIGKINVDADILIDFSTVKPENVEYIHNAQYDYASKFILDAPRTFSIKHESNADYLTAKIYEDPKYRQILYYPAYGDGIYSSELDYNKMCSIETGAIPLIDLGDLDYVNDGMDQFLEQYGVDADKIFKWIVINELVVTYIYEPLISGEDIEYSDYMTNTIDYTDRYNDLSKFWISKFTPCPSRINGYNCKSINLDYTAHLFNRVNNIDIIRKATISITGNEVSKYKNDMINTNNIITYKIVNKIDQNNTAIVQNQSTVKEKIVRSYYDISNIMIKDVENGGGMYADGKMTLYLKHMGSQYMLRLYTVNEDNIRVPLNLAGTVDFKLVFPAADGGLIEIKPNKDSNSYNLSIGQLVFYISREKAKAIMDTPMSERFFAITTDISDNKDEETTLYEGNVEWRS